MRTYANPAGLRADILGASPPPVGRPPFPSASLQGWGVAPNPTKEGLAALPWTQPHQSLRHGNISPER